MPPKYSNTSECKYLTCCCRPSTRPPSPRSAYPAPAGPLSQSAWEEGFLKYTTCASVWGHLGQEVFRDPSNASTTIQGSCVARTALHLFERLSVKCCSKTMIYRVMTSTLKSDFNSLLDPSMSVCEILANPPSIPSIVVGTDAQ